MKLLKKRQVKSLYLFIIAIHIIFISCSKTYLGSSTDYLKYIDEEKNGLKITRSTPEIDFTAKYFPYQLKVLQELESGSENNHLDTLLNQYSQSITFLFSIAPGIGCPVDDLNYYGVYSHEDFAQHKKALNYNSEESFTLQYKGQDYKPILCLLEQDYGFSGKLNFHLVFIPFEEKNNNENLMVDEMKLIFDDPFFYTEQNEFVFSKGSLKSIPQIETKS